MLLSSVDVFLGFFTTIETEGLSALFFLSNSTTPATPWVLDSKSVCQPVAIFCSHHQSAIRIRFGNRDGRWLMEGMKIGIVTNYSKQGFLS